MIFLLLLAAADVRDTADNIRDLKSAENELLDEIDARIRERRALEKRAQSLKGQLEAIAASAERADQRLKADAAAYDIAEDDARRRARQMDKLLRGQAARFVLGADGFAEAIMRTRIVQRAFRRDAQLLSRALRAVEARKAIVAALAADRQHAEALFESSRTVRAEIDTKTRELAAALLEIRSKRSTEERSYYDLREFEARLAREAEEENVAATDTFASLKGKLKWPINGRVAQSFGGARAGIGLDGDPGMTVKAAADGRVEWSGVVDGYERVVIVRHSSNYATVYGGLATGKGVGETVSAGVALGTLGKGLLHFELRRNVVPESPEQWMEPR